MEHQRVHLERREENQISSFLIAELPTQNGTLNFCEGLVKKINRNQQGVMEQPLYKAQNAAILRALVDFSNFSCVPAFYSWHLLLTQRS